MAPLPKKTIQHFMHPSHPLVEVNKNREYLCDDCMTLGIGKRYRYDRCDFDLHEHCGTCPASFSSFVHPQHKLSLVIRKQGTRQNERICDICGDDVEGLFYRCKLCEFDVHPLCTQLPQYVCHVLHPNHPLRFQPSSASWCMVCGGVCISWRYRCGICGFDLHLECLVATLDVPPPHSGPFVYHLHVQPQHNHCLLFRSLLVIGPKPSISISTGSKQVMQQRRARLARPCLSF